MCIFSSGKRRSTAFDRIKVSLVWKWGAEATPLHTFLGALSRVKATVVRSPYLKYTVEKCGGRISAISGPFNGWRLCFPLWQVRGRRADGGSSQFTDALCRLAYLTPEPCGLPRAVGHSEALGDQARRLRVGTTVLQHPGAPSPSLNHRGVQAGLLLDTDRVLSVRMFIVYF